MADSNDDPVPAKARRRSAKFVLPDHHHDEVAGERTDDHIEAFIEGLATATERKSPLRGRGRRRRDTRDRRPFQLETRADWSTALQQEGIRGIRYGRVASVLLLEPGAEYDGTVAEQITRQIMDAIRAEARETDRVARFGPASFRLLLPETEVRAARVLAARISRVVAESADPIAPGFELHTDVVTAPRHGSIEEALDAATRRSAEVSEIA